MKYLPTIGLEVHAELKTKTKMFCGCKNDPDEEKPNTNVCPVCLAHPGTLPTINETAVKKVLKAGLALHCQIDEFSQFDRKSYYYPDLPKGYQISQYKYPLCGPGYLEVILKNDVKKVRLTRIHLEEDTGRLVHPKGADYSLVDFNRAGVPLMELVTEPDMQNGEEAKAFCEALQLILQYIDVSEANMEKGQMRCEVNISLRAKKSDKLGTKVEIKNLNSFKAVKQAIDYEIKRQAKFLEKGKEIVQETRGWDEKKQKTLSQRTKEEAHDYRYFPEPDLPPLKVLKDEPQDKKTFKGSLLVLNRLQKTMPELPNPKRSRFEKDYLLPKEQIEVLVKNKELGEYFEKVASELAAWLKASGPEHDTKQKKFTKAYNLAANYIVTELQKLTKQSKKEATIEKITAENFAELIKMILGNEINSSAAQKILEIMYKTGKDPSDIAKEKNLIQMNDASKLEEIIDKAIEDNPKVVEDYKKGNENALQFFIGQVMKATKGQANPQVAQEILYKKLAK